MLSIRAERQRRSGIRFFPSSPSASGSESGSVSIPVEMGTPFDPDTDSDPDPDCSVSNRLYRLATAGMRFTGTGSVRNWTGVTKGT